MSFTTFPYRNVDRGHIVTKAFEELSAAALNSGEAMRDVAHRLDGHILKSDGRGKMDWVFPADTVPYTPSDPSHITILEDHPAQSVISRPWSGDDGFRDWFDDHRGRAKKRGTRARKCPLMLRVFPHPVMLRLGRP